MKFGDSKNFHLIKVKSVYCVYLFEIYYNIENGFDKHWYKGMFSMGKMNGNGTYFFHNGKDVMYKGYFNKTGHSQGHFIGRYKKVKQAPVQIWFYYM